MNAVRNATLLLFAFATLARGTTYIWDCNGPTAPNPQDGSGTWDVASSNWWWSYNNYTWPNYNDAIFGTNGSAGVVTLATNISVYNITFGSVSNGSYTLTGGSLYISGTATVSSTNSDATINSTITSYSWTKAGAGALVLGSSNTISYTLAVNAGTLWVKHTNSLGTNASYSVVVSNGASLKLDVTNGTFDKPLTLSGSGVGSNGVLQTTANSGALTIGSTQTNRVTLAADSRIAVNGTSLQINRPITGSGKLIKTGSGKLILAPYIYNSDYTGETVIEQGTVQLTNSYGYYYSGLGSTAAGTTVKTNATLDLYGCQIGDETVTINGAGASNAGALVNSSSAYSAGLKYLSLGSDATVGGDMYSGYGWTIGGAGSQLNLNGYTLTKIYSGTTLTLSNTTVGAGSLLVSGGSVVLASGTTASGSGAITVNSGAYLYSGASAGAITKAVVLNGGYLGSMPSGYWWVGGVVASAASNTIGSTNWSFGVGGGLSGTGTVYKTGGSTLYLQGDSSGFSGKLTTTAGATCFNASESGSASATWETTGGSLYLNAVGINVQLGALTGSGGTLSTMVAGSGTFTIGGNNANTTYAGTICNGSGTLGITKVGSGTLTFTKSNTYSGATTVNAGTLLVNGALSGSAVAVAGGGTLGGTGTVNSVAVQGGGGLSPGSGGVGTLSASAVSLAANACYNWDYGVSASDLVAVSGTLTLPSNAVVNVSAGGLELPDEIPLFTYGSLVGAVSLDGWTVNGADSYGVKIDPVLKRIVLRFLGEGPVYEVK